MPADVTPVPEDFHTITPHLVVRDVNRAVEFYRAAFGARELFRSLSPDGETVSHCELLLGNSRFFLTEEPPDQGTNSPLALQGSPITLHLYVPDVDALFRRAVAAGAEEVLPVTRQFWGDRYGMVRDPFGHRWSIASRVEDISPEETQERARDYYAGQHAPPAEGNGAAEGEERLAGVGCDAVRRATGKGWTEWLALLDAAGAADLPHSEIATLLHERHGVPGWWAQMVTVGYEQARGRREKHQKPDGYEISGSKTLGVPLARAFAAWRDEDIRGAWLPNAALTIRKATPDKSLRITWADGRTSVEVLFYPKGDGRSQVSVQHRKLPDADAAARMKAYWAEALNRLKQYLEEGSAP